MHLGISRARYPYTCDGCGSSIRVGVTYIRDDPHPWARWRRGIAVRRLCGKCVPIPGRDDSSVVPDVGQAKLPFVNAVIDLPPVLVQAAIIRAGPNVEDGQLVVGVAIAWYEIIREVDRNARFLHEVPWRKLEELIAGAYEREGWDRVTLTPRAGDRGRDIIVEKHGVGAIRIVDQVKAYAPGRRVTADDVRALLGVLTADSNVSKGIMTTTADFAPGIKTDSELQRFMPYRLELKSGSMLRAWLVAVSQRRSCSD